MTAGATGRGVTLGRATSRCRTRRPAMAACAGPAGGLRFGAPTAGLRARGPGWPCDRAGGAAPGGAMAAGETLVLDHVDLLDGTGGPLQRNVRLVVADGRVSAVAPATDHPAGPADGTATSAAYWDLPGCTALPGLINCHAHLLLEGGALASTAAPAPLTYQVLQAAARAEAMLAAGLTTCRDVSGI